MRGHKWSKAAKAEAIRLRVEERLSQREISRLTSIPKPTLSMILKPYPLTEEEQREASKRARDRREKLDTSRPPVANRPPGNTKQTGDLSEISVIKRLLELGQTVCDVVGDNAAYDLVWDRDGTLLRLQVKTGQLTRGGRTLVFSTIRSNRFFGYGPYDYKGEADLFAVYSPELGKIFMVPVNDAAAHECSLRLEPPFSSASRPAHEYEL